MSRGGGVQITPAGHLKYLAKCFDPIFIEKNKLTEVERTPRYPVYGKCGLMKLVGKICLCPRCLSIVAERGDSGIPVTAKAKTS